MGYKDDMVKIIRNSMKEYAYHRMNKVEPYIEHAVENLSRERLEKMHFAPPSEIAEMHRSIYGFNQDQVNRMRDRLIRESNSAFFPYLGNVTKIHPKSLSDFGPGMIGHESEHFKYYNPYFDNKRFSLFYKNGSFKKNPELYVVDPQSQYGELLGPPDLGVSRKGFKDIISDNWGKSYVKEKGWLQEAEAELTSAYLNQSYPGQINRRYIDNVTDPFFHYDDAGAIIKKYLSLTATGAVPFAASMGQDKD